MAQRLSKLQLGEISLVARGANRRMYIVRKGEAAVGDQDVQQQVAQMVAAQDPAALARVMKAAGMPAMAPAINAQNPALTVGQQAGVPPAPGPDAQPVSPQAAQALKAIARILMPFKDQITDAMMDQLQQAIGIAPDAAQQNDPLDEDAASDAPPTRVAMSDEADGDADDAPGGDGPLSPGDGQDEDDGDQPSDEEEDKGDLDDGEGEDDDPGPDEDDDADESDIDDPKELDGDDVTQPQDVKKGEMPPALAKKLKTKTGAGKTDAAADADVDAEKPGAPEDKDMPVPDKSKKVRKADGDAAAGHQDATLQSILKSHERLAAQHKELVEKTAAMQAELDAAKAVQVQKSVDARAETIQGQTGVSRDDVAAILKSLPADQADKLEAVLKSASEQARVAKSFGGDLYTEMGSRLVPESGTPMAQLEAMIAKGVEEANGKEHPANIATRIYKSDKGRALLRQARGS